MDRRPSGNETMTRTERRWRLKMMMRAPSRHQQAQVVSVADIVPYITAVVTGDGQDWGLCRKS